MILATFTQKFSNKIAEINSVLKGEKVGATPTLSRAIMPLFKYAPVTSCDVERSFSAFKYILSDRRTNMTPEHLEMHLVTYCAGKTKIL